MCDGWAVSGVSSWVDLEILRCVMAFSSHFCSFFSIGVPLTACLRIRFHLDLLGCQHSYCASVGGFAMGESRDENGSGRELYFVAWSEFVFFLTMPSPITRQIVLAIISSSSVGITWTAT